MPSDSCIGVSRSLCKQFCLYGIPGDRTLHIPVGAEIVDNSPRCVIDGPMELREFAAFAGFRLIYVGSLIPGKSVETILSAHHKLEARGTPLQQQS